MKSSQNKPISKKKKKNKKMAESNPPTNTSHLPPAVLDSNALSIALESSSVRGKKKPNAPSIALGSVLEYNPVPGITEYVL